MRKKRILVGLKLLVLAAVALGIVGLLGWAAWQMTPGKRSQKLVEHAREMIAEKAWGESVVALRKALEIYPDDKGIRYMLMSSLFADGKVEQGLAEMETILLMPPFGDDAHRQRFSEYYGMVRGGVKPERLRAMAERIRKGMPQQEHWMAAMLNARAAFLAGDYEQSAAMFGKIADAGERNYQLRLDWAQSLLAAGHAADAGVLFADMVKENPNAIDALNGYATALTLQGKPDDALDVYIRASLVGEPPTLQPLLNGGLFAMNQGRLAEAKKYFIGRLAKYYPDDRQGKLMRMRFDVLSDDKAAFLGLFEAMNPPADKGEFSSLVQWCVVRNHPVWALELLDNHAPKGLDSDDAVTDRIMAMLALRRLDEAAKLVEGVKDKDRKSLLLAELDMRTGRLAEAEKRLVALVEAGKDHPGPVTTQAEQGLARVKALQKVLDSADLLPRARVLLGQGRGAEVLKLLDGVKKPDADLDMLGVMALMQLNRKQEAMARLDTLRKTYPGREDVWLVWARAMAESDPQKALSGLLEAKTSKADGPGLESLIGELQYKLGQHQAAINTWGMVTSHWPNTLAGNVSMVFRAQAYMVEKDWAKAIDIWQQVLKIAPNDPVTLNNLAYSLLQGGGDLQQAERLAEQALTIKPGDAAIADTLAEVRKARQSSSSKTGG